jgi:hypothetical protein
MFPNSIVAWIFNFTEEQSFSLDNTAARENVSISF